MAILLIIGFAGVGSYNIHPYFNFASRMEIFIAFPVRRLSVIYVRLIYFSFMAFVLSAVHRMEDFCCKNVVRVSFSLGYQDKVWLKKNSRKLSVNMGNS